MPSSIAAAAPTVVMPYSLATAFQQSREYLTDENRYRNGEVQRKSMVSTSRKRWQQTKRLSTALLTELREFYQDQHGGLIEFWFYDLYETSPKFSYDDTGSATAGRYAVRFEGEFRQALGLGRHDATLAVVEVS